MLKGSDSSLVNFTGKGQVWGLKTRHVAFFHENPGKAMYLAPILTPITRFVTCARTLELVNERRCYTGGRSFRILRVSFN